MQAWRPDAISLLRNRVAQLDAELVIVSDAGAWSVVRERCDRVDATHARTRYSVTGDAVFVIDHRGVIRFAHHADGPLGTPLSEALDAAVEALAWREHQSKLERVQWTPRAWALKSLVVGCSLAFISQREARFARGTRPIAKISETDAHEPAHAEPPTTPVARISVSQLARSS